MAIDAAGATGGVMQAAVQQQRPQVGDGPQAAAMSNQGADMLYGRGGRDTPEPAVPSWPAKLAVDPQQEMAQLRQRLEEWVQAVMASSAREFNFSKDQLTGELVTSVVNPKTGELVRQVPSAIDLQVQFWLQKVYDAHDPMRTQGGNFNALA